MRFESLSAVTSSASPESTIKTPSARKKLHIKDETSGQRNASKGKRLGDDNNELQASKKKKKGLNKSATIDLEEMLAQTYYRDRGTEISTSPADNTELSPAEDREMEISTPPVVNTKLSPAEGSEVRRSKRIKSKPKQLTVSVKKWSDDQEMCLANALLGTCTLEGEVNLTAFYQRAKELLGLEVSNYHLYEKMRRMRKKFWCMVKEKNEDKLVFRSFHEEAMFLLWEKIWGNMVAVNPTSDEIEAENPNPNEIEAENTKPDEIDAGNHKNNEIEAENPSPVENPNSLKYKALNSKLKENDGGNPNSEENPNPNENDAENSNSGENSELKKDEAENSPQQETHVLNARTNGHLVEKSLIQETHVENDKANDHFVEKPPLQETHVENSREIGPFIERYPCQETDGENARGKSHFVEKSWLQKAHVENARENGHFVDNSGSGLLQREIGGLESRIAAIESSDWIQKDHVENARENGHFVENLGSGFLQRDSGGLESRIAAIESSVRGMESRLEAAIQSSVSRVVCASGAANFQSSRGFGDEVGMGSSALSSVTRTMKELMHGVDSAEEFPGLDTGEARHLQQQWRKIKIWELKTFSEGLELLNNQCKLILKSMDTSDESNGS